VTRDGAEPILTRTLRAFCGRRNDHQKLVDERPSALKLIQDERAGKFEGDDVRSFAPDRCYSRLDIEAGEGFDVHMWKLVAPSAITNLIFCRSYS